MFTLSELEATAELLALYLPSTPQYAWPLLAEAVGTRVTVKHENHMPIGAFKVRGGLTFMDALKRRRPDIAGVVSATRGNHGQSLAFAGRSFGVPVVIVVPYGNSVEKNDAMRALGADLVEHGRDFDEAKAYAAGVAEERGYEFAPSFSRDLVKGVATYALELFSACRDLDTVYVPIGLGSGICGVITVRDLLGLNTEIVGVVAETAAAYALSFAAGEIVETNAALTFADGMAVRIPDTEAFAIIRDGAARIVTVSDDDIAEAMRLYYAATHNLAEGAGAAPLAALMKERERHEGRHVGLILSGQNIDRSWFATVLAGRTPVVG